MKHEDPTVSPQSAKPAAAREAGAGNNTGTANEATAPPLSGTPFSAKEQKTLFLNMVVGVVLLELAVTVGAVVYSIANADKTAAGMVRFNFPWIGYLVTVTLVPVLVMLIMHLISLGFSRTLGGNGLGGDGLGGDPEAVLGTRAAKFYALVRGAPTVILFAGLVLMGAAVYYLDGVMALLLKLGDSFQTVAIWGIGALGVAFCVNAVARAVLAYKTRQLEAEYAFRREVFERTGTLLLSDRQVAIPAAPTAALPSGMETAAEDAEIVVEVESVDAEPKPRTSK